MMRASFPKVLSATALALALGLPSCLAVAVGAVGATGYVLWDRNEGSQDFETTLPAAWAAVAGALQAEGYSPGDTAERTAEGTYETGSLKVTVERRPGDLVRVRVRHGNFENAENKRRIQLFLEAVERNLD